MARMNDRANPLPRANSLPHEDSRPLPVSRSLSGAPRKQLDFGHNANDATTTADFRRPASEGALGHKPTTGGNTDNNIAGRKATNVLITESINSGEGRGVKQHEAPRRGSPTKLAPSDNAKAETSKENHVAPRAILNVPRGYFIVERVEKHKIVEGELRFLIKWEGYPESDNTWEPFESVKNNTVVRDYMQVEGLELPQQKKRGRPSLKDRPGQEQSQTQPLTSPSTRKRRRSERDSSSNYAEEAKKPNKRGRARGRPRKADTPITKSTESRSISEVGENGEAIAQLQTAKPPPKKQHIETRVNSHAQPRKALRAVPANPSTFVYNFKVEAKRLSPAARKVRRQQLELELAALQAADQEEEDD